MQISFSCAEYSSALFSPVHQQTAHLGEKYVELIFAQFGGQFDLACGQLSWVARHRSGGAKRARPSCMIGMSEKSVGSWVEAIMVITGKVSLPSDSTKLDLPVPGGPHKSIGILIWPRGSGVWRAISVSIALSATTLSIRR